MSNFAFDIKNFEAAALLAINNKACQAFEDLGVEIVEKSPTPPGEGGFSKGLLKNSWYVQVNGVDNTVGTVANPNGVDSLSRIKAISKVLPFYGKDGFVTLTNSTEHAYRAEYLGWPAGEGANGFVWSGRVGPYAMVQTAITNYKAKHV